jgi:putative endonuclease
MLVKSSKRNYIYVGITNNPDRRLLQHNRGYNKSTKPYRPFFLFYMEQMDNRVDARKREKYFKTASGKHLLRFKLEEFLEKQ